MRLYDLVDPYILKEHTDNGLVSVQRHPTLPLMIHNYTHKAQYEPHWGDGTIDYCRGLIIDDDYNIVARPFKKFHNLNTDSIPETLEGNLPSYEPIVTKKYDGSLGIYWEWDRHFGVATRGSFVSEQAIWATQWLKNHSKGYGFQTLNHSLDQMTPLFEIIYDANRIVVKYDFEGLVLLGAVHKETGGELSRPGLVQIAQENNLRVADDYSLYSLTVLKEMNEPNEEGYVISYPTALKDPIKVKIKMVDYVRLHRIVTGLNAHSLWEIHKAGGNTEFLKDTPDHVQKWAASWAAKFLGDYTRIEQDAMELYINRPFYNGEGRGERKYRAECASYFHRQQGKQHLKSLFFVLMDGKDIKPLIWDMVEPSGADKSFQPAQGEDA